MMGKALFLSSFFCLLGMLGQAQNSPYELEVRLLWKEAPIQLEKNYYSNALGDSLQFSSLRFYLSHLQLIQSNRVSEAVLDAKLIDLSDSSSMHLSWTNEEAFDSIRFLFGLTDEIQKQGVAGGDLDPQKGMYWTWKSGYILCKIEGSSPSLSTRKNQFVFHLGGYESPYAVSKELNFTWVKDARKQLLEIDLYRFFESIDLKSNPTLMSAGEKAFRMSEAWTAVFQLKEP